MSLAEALTQLPTHPSIAFQAIDLDIQSRALASATFTMATGTLTIVFTDGNTATYSVDLHTALGLENAGSPGHYFNANIR